MNFISTIALATLLGMALCAVQDYVDSSKGPYRDPWRPQQRIAQRPRKTSWLKRNWALIAVILFIAIIAAIVGLSGCRMLAL